MGGGELGEAALAGDHRGHSSRDRHGGQDRADVALEEVGAHASHVADVVADVVGDHGRVAGVVLRNASFDFSDQVSADVGRLGEDPAADPREERDRARAEAEPEDRPKRLRRSEDFPEGPRDKAHVEPADSDRAEADDREAHDRARAEADAERFTEARLGGLGRPNGCSGSDPHADIARDSAGHGAEHEGEGDREGVVVSIKREERDRDHDHVGSEPLVFGVQEGLGAVLNRLGDLAHLLVAVGLGEDFFGLVDRVEHSYEAQDGPQEGEGRCNGYCQRKHQGTLMS